ncbi:MraY family glycosyltransferase [Mucisphaera sp.]|uniref:MraY family glycosyltransferase n=1 Tax=Mucisphaera sp. TaxID=2913024 RepID=UPI003D101CD3
MLGTLASHLALAAVATAVAGLVVLRIAHRLSLIDQANEAHKAASAQVPNVGGVAIVFGLTAGLIPLLFASTPPEPWLLWTLAAAITLHFLGLIDDRTTLSAPLKLAVQAAVAITLTTAADIRVLTLLDDLVPFGYGLSILISTLWIITICNAINFLDNMDGLSASVSTVAALVFAASATLAGQTDVAILAAALAGGCLGFLFHNAPPARMYMGDSGSLLLGLLLAVISIQITYLAPGALGELAADPLTTEVGNLQSEAGGWHAVLTPLIVLAVPLYDFLSVVILRLRAGRSPMSPDRNHLSHRLERLGLSRPTTVALITLLTLATGLSAVTLASLSGNLALIAAGQTLAILGLIAIFETLGPDSR